ncbi:unannotated protein [freshwater metagenome]|uniref:Unannotated protein n=1 Tax=freshwater metagenome TaxID=449393 RepID=A0A6J7J0Q3_9ZZZZ
MSEAQTCYRHPGRETRVQCSSCGRPICPDCMQPTPVGMRCPECGAQKTKVRTAASVAAGATPVVTFAMIAACVVAYLAEGGIGVTGAGGSLVRNYALWGPAVEIGDWWRLATYGFLHAGLLHIGFNMFLLFLLGRELEPQLGSGRFAALYVAALLAGAFGALVFDPNAVTVGASGAIFGVMGAAAVMLWRRGMNPLHTDIGMLIVFNLVLGFVIPNVSVGGHIGGLVGGALAGLGIAVSQERRAPWIGWLACVVVAAVAVVGSELVVRSGAGGLGL